MYNRESFIAETNTDKPFNDKLNFAFNDYDVADFFARRAERNGGEVKILSQRKWKDKGFHPYLEFGGFRNTWDTDFDIFSSSELVPGNRLEFGVGVQRQIGSNFWVKGGIHYTAYKNSGEIESVAGPGFANSGEVVVAENTVEASYLGFNLAGGYDFLNLKNGTFYATVRLGMGLVLSEGIELQTFMQRETDDNRTVLFAGPFDFRPTQDRDPRLYLPNDMIGVGAGLGFSLAIADRFTPFVELRAQANTNAGRKYSYTELGLAGGIVF